MAEVRHTHSTEGDSTRITPAAALSCSSPAMVSGNRNITAEKTRPVTPNSSSAVWKTRRACRPCPSAHDRATSREAASGSPAVDSISSRL